MGVFDQMGKITAPTRSKAEEIVSVCSKAGYKLTRIWGIGTSGVEHPTGRALDFMIDGKGLGKAVGDFIADYLWTNRVRLGVKWIIWNGRIRSTSPGKPTSWTYYAGRNRHTDHVHVFFGTASYKAPPAGTGASGGGGSVSRVVDLSKLIAAAKHDPRAKQGGTTAGAADDVRIVEAALKAEDLLDSKWASDGSFGTYTIKAYAAWQRRCGYRGDDADGIPGRASLIKLGKKYDFKVVS